MRQRGAIPADLKVHYRTRWYWYEDRKGDPIRAKPLYHREPAVRLLESGLTATIGRPPKPSETMGTLRVTLDSVATMPVMAVDGHPVAVGHGEVHLSLPEGHHLVEVQNLDTVSPAVVEIFAGETAAVIWREEDDPAQRALGFELADSSPITSGLPAYHLLVAALILCGLPFGAVATTALDTVSARVALLLVAVAAVAAAIGYPWSRRERDRVRAVAIERRRVGAIAPQPYPWGTLPDWSNPILLGDNPDRPPELAPGGAALVLELRAHRHLWKRGLGVVDRDAELAALWARPPRVVIDGREQYATWGSWWYPLRPGAHRVLVEAPGWDRPGAASAVAELTVHAEPGEVVRAVANAHLRAHRDADGTITTGPSVLALTEAPPQ